jgi:hypothetical protein
MKTQRFALLAAAAALFIAGCGGGTGGTGMTGGTPATSFGTITAFGSVFVNGVEFSTSGATIILDGNPVTQNELRRGMVVTVSGSRSGNSGSATRIDVDDAVKGFVEAIATDRNHWTVMGQTVLVDDQTKFENGIVPTVGDFVEVHGLVRGEGVIAASFIDKKNGPPFPAFAVKGFVKNHSDVSKTFQIGALTVNYANATIKDMPNPASSWNGLLVEAKGSTCTGTAPVCGTLTASKVEPNGPQMQDAADFEVEGFVTRVTSTSDFVVGNQRVVTTGSTRFEGGIASDIAVGVKLEVEGVLSGGVLTASKIEFGDGIKLEADIAALGANSFTLSGLPGVSVTVNGLTQFDNVAGFAGLSNGDHLRIRGRASGSNTVIATEVEKRSPDARVELQGPIQSITGASPNQIVTILGVAVNTTGVVFEDVNRVTFFAQAVVGTLVKARGSLSGTTVTWSEMELED